MPQIQNVYKDTQVEEQKCVNYRGTAHIRLKWFPQIKPSDLDTSHLEKLKGIFKENCCQNNIHNHVPATIDQQHFNAALKISGISELPKNFSVEYPELSFEAGYQLDFLHGKHRIQAAREVLFDPNDWWTVDFYASGKTKRYL